MHNRLFLPTGMELSSKMRIIFFTVFITLQWHLACADSVKCQDHCSSGSCCEVKSGLITCCPFNNGVCCPNRKSCCPQGSECSLSDASCKYPSGSLKHMAALTESQKPAKLQTNDVPVILCPDESSFCPSSAVCCQNMDGLWGCCNQKSEFNSLRRNFDWAASPAVYCPGDQLACPSNATCCQSREGLWACCNHAHAKCCNDGLHCCPHGTECGSENGICTPVGKHETADLDSVLSYTIVWPSVGPSRKSVEHRWGLKNRADWNRTMSDVMAYHDVLCDDGKYSCPSKTSCCPDGNNGFTCCPFAEATCCSDRQHCCPVGYTCDISLEMCVKQEISVNPSVSVVCPNAEFSCLNGSTCCALPNDEWACCPFDNAVCCSDLLHCCPENFVCDIQNEQCVNNTMMSKSYRTVDSICENGLISCPTGTCCSNSEGIDSCCPYSDAVCCPNDLCCPSGTVCDIESGGCKDRSSIPWSKKVHGIRGPIAGGEFEKSKSSLKQQYITCQDQKSVCIDNRTCCPLIDGSFGCCPLPNGNCCADGKHCCPVNSVCSEDGRCILRRLNVPTQPLVDAELMVPVAQNSIPSMHFPSPIASAKIYSTWCGACGADGFCCPNALGEPNRMCCSLPAGVCCPDGAHCCPRGFDCVGGGKCEPTHMHTQTYAASNLVPPAGNGAFLNSIDPKSLITSITAPLAFKAKLDPLFLIKSYYSLNVGRFTVCPDLLRVCSLDQKCCLSAQFGYTCVPSKATCCSATADTYCPSGSNCTIDKLGCIGN